MKTLGFIVLLALAGCARSEDTRPTGTLLASAPAQLDEGDDGEPGDELSADATACKRACNSNCKGARNKAKCVAECRRACDR